MIHTLQTTTDMAQIPTLQSALEAARKGSNPEASLTLSRIRIRMTPSDTLTPLEAKFAINKVTLAEISRITGRELESENIDGLLTEHSMQLTHGDATVTLIANTALV